MIIFHCKTLFASAVLLRHRRHRRQRRKRLRRPGARRRGRKVKTGRQREPTRPTTPRPDDSIRPDGPPSAQSHARRCETTVHRFSLPGTFQSSWARSSGIFFRLLLIEITSAFFRCRLNLSEKRSTHVRWISAFSCRSLPFLARDGHDSDNRRHVARVTCATILRVPF